MVSKKLLAKRVVHPDVVKGFQQSLHMYRDFLSSFISPGYEILTHHMSFVMRLTTQTQIEYLWIKDAARE